MKYGEWFVIFSYDPEKATSSGSKNNVALHELACSQLFGCDMREVYTSFYLDLAQIISKLSCLLVVCWFYTQQRKLLKW